MKNTLENIKREYETVVKSSMAGSYCYYKLLMDKNIHKVDNVSEILEYTLHRMIEEGFTPEDIKRETLMFIPTKKQRKNIPYFRNIAKKYIIVDTPEIII